MKTTLPRTVIVIFVLVVVVVALSGWCIYYLSENQPKHERYERRETLSYTYTVNVTVNQSGNYSLYLPTLVWRENKTSADFVFNTVQIVNGTGELSLTETEHGVSLNITSNNSIILESKGQMEFLSDHPSPTAYKPRLILSMEKDPRLDTGFSISYVQHFVNCLKTNTNQTLIVSIWVNTSYSGLGVSDYLYYKDYDHGPATIEIIDNGWQIIRGYAILLVT